MNNTLEYNVIEDNELDALVGRRKSTGAQQNPTTSQTNRRVGGVAIKSGKTIDKAKIQMI